MDPSTSKEGEKLTETQLELQNFFPKVLEDIKKIKVIEPGNQLLPLARIKKIMKLDEDVKMISAEAPLLFAKATEIFIHELTLRAWLHTEDNKRRTLQRNDIAMAISKYDQFDFLIDIVPRDEIKPKKEAEKPQTVQEQVFYVQAPSQQIQTVTVPTVQAPSTPQTIQLQNTTTSPGQNIILQSPTQTQSLPTSLIQIGSPNQQIQLVQQVMSPNGEISNIPVQMTQQQLAMLRSQMAGTPLIVQAPQTQIFQTASGQNIAIPINSNILSNLGQQIQYINPQQATLQQQQAQQHQAQQQAQVKEENQH
jgi:nuclear transcription factor Y gamma